MVPEEGVERVHVVALALRLEPGLARGLEDVGPLASVGGEMMPGQMNGLSSEASARSQCAMPQLGSALSARSSGSRICAQAKEW